MISANPLKAKLNQGDVVLGAWSIIDSPINCEIMVSAGFDFLILDLEHGSYNFSSLEACIRACEGAGASPLVRAPGLNPAIVQNALDYGAHGLVFPQVAGVVEAQKAISMTQYPPNGVRGFNPFTRAGNYGLNATSKPKIENGYCLNAIIVENMQSYLEYDRLLEIPDLDLIYLGVYDMSVAFGAKGDLKNPQLLQFLETCIPKARQAGKAVGVMAIEESEMKTLMEMGANFIVCGVDSSILANASASAHKAFRSIQGKKA